MTAKRYSKLSRHLLRELPYNIINIGYVHGQFNNSLPVQIPTKKFLQRRIHCELDFHIYIIDQARGQEGWILVDRDEVEVHKNAKIERGQYPATLTQLAWSMKDLLYGIESNEKKNDLRTCLFSSTEKETS